MPLYRAPMYEHIFQQVGILPASTAAGTRWFSIIGTGTASGTGLATGRPILVWDATKFPGVTVLNLHVSMSATVAQTGVTFTYGLYPVAWSGTTSQTPTFGTVVAGSTIAFVAPGNDAELEGVSADFARPASDTYMIGMVTDATMPAACMMSFQAILRGR